MNTQSRLNQLVRLLLESLELSTRFMSICHLAVHIGFIISLWTEICSIVVTIVVNAIMYLDGKTYYAIMWIEIVRIYRLYLAPSLSIQSVTKPYKESIGYFVPQPPPTSNGHNCCVTAPPCNDKHR